MAKKQSPPPQAKTPSDNPSRDREGAERKPLAYARGSDASLEDNPSRDREGVERKPLAYARGSDPIAASLEAQRAEVAEARKGPGKLSFAEFFEQYPPSPDYVYGRHTRGIIAEMQAACDAVARGESYHVIVTVPPRHGKSDICSRRFIPYVLCRDPDMEGMLATYGADLSEDMAHEARKCFEEAGPRWGRRLSVDRNQLGAWKVEGHRGGMVSVGIGGTVTGRGADFLIIDDYYKNREQAESETIRKSVWNAFQSDLMTRLAPAHAVIIVANRWHEDDLVARILDNMQRDADYPRFKVVNFPAQDEHGAWLFTERYPESWYRAQKATTGTYAWQSQFLGDPQPRQGNMLRSDLAEIIEADEVPPGLRYVRAWDLASTEKERAKDDPDYTVGTKMALHKDELYIVDVIRGQWTAPGRDARIIDAAKRDGRAVNVIIEVVAGYKDTYENVKKILSGLAVVKKQTPQGDKVSEASILEPIFEGGKVKIVRAPWNADWKSEIARFPKGKHDDQCDSMKIGAKELLRPVSKLKFSN